MRQEGRQATSVVAAAHDHALNDPLQQAVIPEDAHTCFDMLCCEVQGHCSTLHCRCLETDPTSICI